MFNEELDYLALKARYNDIATELGGEIYGAFWNKTSSPTLTRLERAQNKQAIPSVDTIAGFNDFDITPLFKDFQTVTDTYGNVFVRIPKMYIRKKDGASFKSVEVSRKPTVGGYLPWCFWDFTNSKELDYVDVGAYKGSISGGKLESKPNVFPAYNQNIVQFRTAALANNVGAIQGYQQLDIHVVDLLQQLFYIEMATLNSQGICQGFSTGQWATTHTATVAENGVNRIILANANADLYRVGQTIGIGTSQGGNQICADRVITAIAVYDGSNKAITFDGATVNIAVGNMLYNLGWKNGFSANIAGSVGSLNNNTDGKYPFVWHGIESLYGDMWQFVDGLNINNNQAWICKNASNYASNVFSSPYEQLGYGCSNANNWVKAMGFDANNPFCELPVDVTGGSSTTFYCDNYWQSTGQRIARVGGDWLDGSLDGLSYWALTNGASGASVNVGGRLVRKAL